MPEQRIATRRGGLEDQVRVLRKDLRKAIHDQHADGCAIFYVLRGLCDCMMGWYLGGV